jgi:hypothetical protein
MNNVRGYYGGERSVKSLFQARLTMHYVSADQVTAIIDFQIEVFALQTEERDINLRALPANLNSRIDSSRDSALSRRIPWRPGRFRLVRFALSWFGLLSGSAAR